MADQPSQNKVTIPFWSFPLIALGIVLALALFKVLFHGDIPGLLRLGIAQFVMVAIAALICCFRTDDWSIFNEPIGLIIFVAVIMAVLAAVAVGLFWLVSLLSFILAFCLAAILMVMPVWLSLTVDV